MKARRVIDMILNTSNSATDFMPVGTERSVVLALLAVIRVAVDTFFDDGVSAEELIKRIKRPKELDLAKDDAEIDALVRAKDDD